MIAPDPKAEIPQSIESAHFIGIGGSGMSGIARMFLDRGVRVSGSDRSESDYTKQLREHGATVTVGHAAENLPEDVDAVVVTSALWPENPELVGAKERGVPILHRSQALVWLTRGSELVAVAGAHGKTTSTGMLATALVQLDADPSFVNGGVIGGLKTNSHIGTSEIFVVEADESDGSFLFYDTAIALITNIDSDHLDHYGSEAAFEAAFADFANRASKAVVISADDAQAVQLQQHLTHPRIVTFGESAEADVRVSDITPSGSGTRFTITADGIRAQGSLAVPGRHNALNAAGAIAVLRELGYPVSDSLAALEAFGGTKRRFDLQGVVRGVSVFDDYAHHPTEVEAALSAARTVVGNGRIIAVHQPHLYSRTQAMHEQFAQVLERYADHTIVLAVDGAREDPVAGVTGALVAEDFIDSAHVDYRPEWPAAATTVAQIAREGDFVITLGCGNVNLLVPELLDALAKEPQSERSVR